MKTGLTRLAISLALTKVKPFQEVHAMADAIVATRLCCRCTLSKPATEFYPSDPRCKPCLKLKNPRIRELYAIKADDPAFLAKKNASSARRRKAGKHRAAKKKYLRSEQGRKTSAAHNAVHRAVRAGTMPVVTTLVCPCGKAATEYHHHLGYDREHRLHVVPLCKRCHKLGHRI
jgi:hypothetical protein